MFCAKEAYHRQGSSLSCCGRVGGQLVLKNLIIVAVCCASGYHTTWGTVPRPSLFAKCFSRHGPNTVQHAQCPFSSSILWRKTWQTRERGRSLHARLHDIEMRGERVEGTHVSGLVGLTCQCSEVGISSKAIFSPCVSFTLDDIPKGPACPLHPLVTKPSISVLRPSGYQRTSSHSPSILRPSLSTSSIRDRAPFIRANLASWVY